MFIVWYVGNQFTALFHLGGVILALKETLMH